MKTPQPLFLFFITVVTSLILGCTEHDELYIPNTRTNSNLSKNLTANTSDSTHYYYYKGEKIYLNINKNKRYVISGTDKYQKGQLIDTHQLASWGLSPYNPQKIAKQNSNSTPTDTTNTTSVKAIEYVVGDSIPLSNLFYIKLKATSDINMLQNAVDEIGCQIEGAVQSDPLWIRISHSTQSIHPTSLEAANYLYETNLFADVDPGFIINYGFSYTPTDPYYSSQWALHGAYSLNAESAWNYTLGSPNITIAVIDGGIDTQHPDILDSFTSYAYNCDTGTNSPISSEHGTAVAGVIAANHNTIGIAGIAPNSKIMNISSTLRASSTISEELANGINYAWQNGADVLNLSWGDQGGTLYNSLHSALLESAISNALTKGRNGKGSVVVAASGNHYIVEYPATSNSDILVVGSIKSDGTIAEFSGQGDQMDVVAPGVGIYTLNNIKGYEPVEGTSFSAPYASGVAALILSENPNLTQKQVCSIIQETANRKTWNKTYGYGNINASRAIEVVNGKYVIEGNYGSSTFSVAKFYIVDLPKSATVTWSTSKNIAQMEAQKDSVTLHYSFSGQSLSDEVIAKITYCGMSHQMTLPITLHNEPKITSVERIYYAPEKDRIDFKVNCTDPDATITWSGSDYLDDFPYSFDASFADHPNLYKSLYTYGSGTYTLTVKAENQYGWDSYKFNVTAN